ncbi:MAG: AI-2E family transporter [bacterium]
MGARISDIARTRSPVAILMMVSVLAAAAWFMYRTREIWEYFLISIAVAYLIGGPVSLIEKRNVPRTLAVVVVFVVLGALLAAALVLLIPPLLTQINTFTDDFPRYVSDVQSQVGRFERWLARTNIPGGTREVPNQILEGVQNASGALLKNSIDRVFDVFTRLYAFIIIPLTTFYILKDTHRFREVFISLFPPDRRADVEKLVTRIDRAFGGFIRSRLKLCLVVGVGSCIALSAVRLKYSIVLGIICGVCEFVPYVGPVVGAVPALIIGLFYGKFIYVLIAILIVQIVENVVFVPRIIGTEVGLHPVTVILALLAGGKFAGLGGMVLSIPAVAAAKILLDYFFFEPKARAEAAEEPPPPAPPARSGTGKVEP